jgi:hypothetical protein
MKIAYIAGPYRAPTVFGLTENIQRAREAAAEFWKLGYAVICPHMNSAFMDGVVPDSTFLAGDREFIRRMRPGDVFVLLPGWAESGGAKVEALLASSEGLHIVEWLPAEKTTRRLDRAAAVILEAFAHDPARLPAQCS